MNFSFLIGQDGFVYEGRGWNVQPGRPNEYPGYEGKYLEITFMDDANSKLFKTKYNLYLSLIIPVVLKYIIQSQERILK